LYCHFIKRERERERERERAAMLLILALFIISLESFVSSVVLELPSANLLRAFDVISEEEKAQGVRAKLLLLIDGEDEFAVLRKGEIPAVAAANFAQLHGLDGEQESQLAADFSILVARDIGDFAPSTQAPPDIASVEIAAAKLTEAALAIIDADQGSKFVLVDLRVNEKPAYLAFELGTDEEAAAKDWYSHFAQYADMAETVSFVQGRIKEAAERAVLMKWLREHADGEHILDVALTQVGTANGGDILFELTIDANYERLPVRAGSSARAQALAWCKKNNVADAEATVISVLIAKRYSEITGDPFSPASLEFFHGSSTGIMVLVAAVGIVVLAGAYYCLSNAKLGKSVLLKGGKGRRR
jgi:hypothetical protein